MKLGDLGAGFPLYFHYKVFTGIIYLCLILIVGVPTIYTNYKQGRGGEWVVDNKTVLLTKTTLGNHGRKHINYFDNSDINLVVILNSCFILVVFILSLLLRAQQANIIQKVDTKTVTASDFTILAYNIPLDKSSKELKQWLEDTHWCTEIKSISYCYDIRTMISL